MVHSSPEIAKVFYSYYSRIYVKQNEESSGGGEKNLETQEYLRGLDLPTVPKEELDQLEAPVIQEEVIRAIKYIPDGYSVLYYKWFQKLLIPKLCDYLNTIAEGENLGGGGSLLAYITLILKEGKKPGATANCRTILMLNIDCEGRLYASI